MEEGVGPRRSFSLRSLDEPLLQPSQKEQSEKDADEPQEPVAREGSYSALREGSYLAAVHSRAFSVVTLFLTLLTLILCCI